MISFFGIDRPTDEDVLESGALVNLSRSVLYPRYQKDWDIVTHHFGKIIAADDLKDELFERINNVYSSIDYTIECKRRGVEVPIPAILFRL